MMEVARDMDRNDAVIGQALDRYSTNVVQDGFTLDPQTGDDDINALITEYWREWSKDPKA